VGQLRQPCGRYEHDAIDHPILGHGQVAGYMRPPMACTVQGCLARSRKRDCHDFYDTAVATRDADDRLELAP
jgi:hypothetical protein